MTYEPTHILYVSYEYKQTDGKGPVHGFGFTAATNATKKEDFFKHMKVFSKFVADRHLK